MTLKNKLQHELHRAASAAPQSITVEDGALRLICELEEVYPLVCRVTRLAVEANRLRTATAEQLRAIGETLAARINYLLEPISPVEIDREGCVVQLRSNPPQADDDGTCYYELVVRRDELALRRYQKQRGQVRRPIAATVTQEVLLRLAQDFEAVLAG